MSNSQDEGDYESNFETEKLKQKLKASERNRSYLENEFMESQQKIRILEAKNEEGLRALRQADDQIIWLKNEVKAKEEMECDEKDMSVEARRVQGPKNFQSPEFLLELKAFFQELEFKVNVCFLGPFGSGKSALLTTLATGLIDKKRILRGFAPSRSNCTHVTTAVKKYHAGKVNLIDCWGFSENNLKENEVVMILDGMIKDGASMNDGKRTGRRGQESASKTDRIDAVIVVVDGEDFVGNDGLIPRLNDLIKLLVEQEFIPMIALTKIDKVDVHLEGNLRNGFKSREVRERMALVSSETGLPVNQIFPVKSYDCEFDRDDDIEKLALLCLKEVIQANVLDRNQVNEEPRETSYDHEYAGDE